jgi:hypothetical protein
MPDQGGAMNKLLAAAVLGFASFPAQAICVSDVGHTYGANLDAADHVFVAMITKATFDGDAAALQARYDAKATRDGSVAAIRAWFDYQINYDFMVMAVLKGDPKAVGHLEGRALYDAPDGRDARIAESIAWQPGDVVLVVATGTGPAGLGFCGPSKPFDWAMSELAEEGRHDLDQFLHAGK